MYEYNVDGSGGMTPSHTNIQRSRDMGTYVALLIEPKLVNEYCVFSGIHRSNRLEKPLTKVMIIRM